MAVFLLNGIDTYFGAQVAQVLSNQAGVDLIGLGRSAPIASVGQTTVLTGEFSGPQLAQVLQEKRVETVIHLAMAGEEQSNADSEATLQQNVLGSMLLLGACLAAKVKRVIIRSSTLIYGASVTNPVFIPEKQVRSCSLKPGLIREYADLDTFATNFVLKHPQIELVLLRCASLVGEKISSPLHNVAHAFCWALTRVFKFCTPKMLLRPLLWRQLARRSVGPLTLWLINLFF